MNMRHLNGPPPDRRGFTLVEMLVAMVLLMVCIMGLSQSTMRFSRTIGDSGLRAQAQSLADVQIALARTWPTYATLEDLQGARYNGARDGLTRVTLVTADTAGGLNVKRVKITVQSVTTGALNPAVVRSITVTAP